MKAFAGIKIDALEFDNLSACNSRRIQKALINNYLEQINFLESTAANAKPVKLQQILHPNGQQQYPGYRAVKHLVNYVKMNITPALSDEQEIALAIRFLPEISSNPETTRDDLIIKLVRDSVGIYETYDLRDIKRVEKKVKECRSKLNFTGRWDRSVFDITKAIERKNLAMAYEILDTIKNLHVQHSPLSKSDLPYVYSLQLVFYIDIIEFLYKNLGNNPLIDYFNTVEEEYGKTLQLLRKLPELESSPQQRHCNFGLLFSTCVSSSSVIPISPSKLSRIS